MDNANFTKQLLLQLLSERSPELGARLKQRLNHEFISRGLGRFDEKAYGYLKFSDFLEGTFGDTLSIERQRDVGDIQVTIRTYNNKPASSSATSSKIEPSSLPRMRNEVWQAFSNPDPRRKRFLNKITGAVCHYLESEPGSAVRNEVERTPDNFEEIQPVDGETQIQWMKEYLDTINLPPKEKAAIERLIGYSYSSDLNAAFSRALGNQGAGWRRYRTRGIISRIEAWAKERNVSFETLKSQHKRENSITESAATGPAPHSPRSQASKLMEILDDDDIARVVLPTLLTLVLVKSRY